MMDYYGSIVKTNESIREDLVAHFSRPRKPRHGSGVFVTLGTSSGYSEEYIDSLIERLGVYTSGIIHDPYSVTGWGVFQFPVWIRKFEEQIGEDTDNAKKKLVVAKVAVKSPDFPRDMNIARQIASHLQHLV